MCRLLSHCLWSEQSFFLLINHHSFSLPSLLIYDLHSNILAISQRRIAQNYHRKTSFEYLSSFLNTSVFLFFMGDVWILKKKKWIESLEFLIIGYNVKIKNIFFIIINYIKNGFVWIEFFIISIETVNIFTNARFFVKSMQYSV